MNILLFDKPQSEFVQLSAMFKENGHQLVVATDESIAKATFARIPVQMAILTARSADDYLISLLPEFRRLGDVHGTHIVLLGKDLPDDFLVRAYNAGADSEIRPPFSRALLLARLAAAERVTRRATGAVLVGPDVKAEVKPPAAAAAAPLDVTAQSQAWHVAASSIQSAASKFLTLPVLVADASVAKQPIAHACRIMLSNVKDQIEFRIALGADARSARQLAIHLFGPEGEDLAGDTLSELANIFMGVMKAAFGAESISFTGGLPEPIEADHILRPIVTYKHQNAIDLVIGEARIVVHLGIRSKANLHLPAKGLHEGMVLAKDVFNARGLMVLKGSTRLSQNMIEQMEKILPPRATVEVMAP